MCSFKTNTSRCCFCVYLIQNPIQLLTATVPNLEIVRNWTDYTVSQYQNKTIFKIVSCHDEYFGCKASWSYMEIGHDKGPFDPTGSTAKSKADQVVKNEKVVIQEAVDFYEWTKIYSAAISYSYASVEDYEKSEKFV